VRKNAFCCALLISVGAAEINAETEYPVSAFALFFGVTAAH
jgi:hypothetical protein